MPADLALKLPAAAGVVIEAVMRGVAERADGVRGNVTVLAFMRLDGLNGFAVAEAAVFVPELPVLFDKRFDDREFVCEELFVFRAMEFLMCPLLERDVSADKKNKPADLQILFLNDFK